MDRNVINEKPVTDQDGSLSARRAWIEIFYSLKRRLHEPSLSARRAWIEIDTGTYHPHFHVGRSPQGERG